MKANLLRKIDSVEYLDKLQIIADSVRLSVIRTIMHAQSGHLGGCLSSVELMTAVYFGGQFKFDQKNPNNKSRDLILNRGHLGPLRYSIFALMGWIDPKELEGYRQFGTRLPGHEDMNLTPGVDITPSGSLGMLLSYGVGAAVESNRLGLNRKVLVFLGDGEEQEGNVGEAARHAASMSVDNLICILDKNGKQLSRTTSETDGATDICTVWKGYGWKILKINNGHNFSEILPVYRRAVNAKGPVMIIANTIKGKGLQGAEADPGGYHTLSLTPDVSVVTTAISEMTKSGVLSLEDLSRRNMIKVVTPPEILLKSNTSVKIIVNIQVPDIFKDKGNVEKSQKYYYQRLAELLKRNKDYPPIYYLTPDFMPVSSLSKCQMETEVSVIDLGIREQHGIGMAHGLSLVNPDARIILNYPDTFSIRALDQIYAACLSKCSKMVILGQISGLTQVQNGETHQGSGQIGSLLNVYNIKVYEPGDIIDLYNILNQLLTENNQIAYLRIHRATVNTFPRQSEDKFNITNYIVHEPDKKPELVIVSCGFMTNEAISASKILELKYKISVRVVNLVNLLSAGEDQFRNRFVEGAPVLTIYNGRPDILPAIISRGIMDKKGMRPSLVKGIGFVRGKTGKLEELTKHFGLDKEGIILAAIQLLEK